MSDIEELGSTKDSLLTEGGKMSVSNQPVARQLAFDRVDDKEIVTTEGFVRTARLADEWYVDIEHPEQILETIKRGNVKADVFTFWQRLPDGRPKYSYYSKWESIASLPVNSFEYWWTKQVNPKTRNLVRKAEKSGVTVRPAEFNDEFVQGMTDIFNEAPIRQGKPFWHYGKDVETIRREFSRYLFREDLYGAYHNNELIGFIFLAHAGRYALLGQIISKISHREKAPNNALIAKAVEVCSNKQIPYLVYANWTSGSLGDFKRHNGFERVDLPRYYVPLTLKGQLALKLGLYDGIKGLIPDKVMTRLLELRRRWYSK